MMNVDPITYRQSERNLVRYLSDSLLIAEVPTRIGTSMVTDELSPIALTNIILIASSLQLESS
ncbi:MAG: hypothetical protein HYV97_02230 [Bdellovibrio sp.]|nr:hypothetical protein [Bdellovibrio sp.]